MGPVRLTGNFYVNSIDETTLNSVNEQFGKTFKAAFRTWIPYLRPDCQTVPLQPRSVRRTQVVVSLYRGGQMAE